MNPHQRNKIDVNKMSAEEQKIFRLYGKVPNTKDLLQNKFKERKYFDSGDYALSKAGKATDVGVSTIGSQHPVPEDIPHLSSPVSATGSSGGILGGSGGSGGLGGVGGSMSGSSGGSNSFGPGGLPGPPGMGTGNPAGSPVKESSFLNRETSVDDQDGSGQDAGGPLDEAGRVVIQGQS